MKKLLLSAAMLLLSAGVSQAQVVEITYDSGYPAKTFYADGTEDVSVKGTFWIPPNSIVTNCDLKVWKTGGDLIGGNVNVATTVGPTGAGTFGLSSSSKFQQARIGLTVRVTLYYTPPGGTGTSIYVIGYI